MRCDNCGNEEAIIQLTKLKDNEMKVLHLCEGCAAEEGVEPPAVSGSAPLVDFLKQIGQSIGETSPTGRCPRCGLTPTQLKQVGRLGCAHCYTHYEQHLRSLLRRLHGGTQHVGKAATAPNASEGGDRKSKVQSLRRSLQRAIEAEDFEHAAVLRDQIRRIDGPEELQDFS